MNFKKEIKRNFVFFYKENTVLFIYTQEKKNYNEKLQNIFVIICGYIEGLN